jgi:hypothetical protein
MTTTVFLSGSRNISRLNDAIRIRLQTITDKGFHVVVGDANGADKAIQSYLATMQYANVTVFCAGDVCRNNLGSWEQRNIIVDPKLKGRDFYAQKDKVMASEADYGFVLWDGKSTGSISNVLELMKNGKSIIIYFAPDKSFHALKQASDIEELLERCDSRDYRSMNEKIHFARRLDDLRLPLQSSMNL